MATITLNSSNKYRQEITDIIYPQTISWSSAIPDGKIIRIEYENGAFIDLRSVSVNNDGQAPYELEVVYSSLVSGDDGGSSTFELIDETNEMFDIFVAKKTGAV